MSRKHKPSDNSQPASSPWLLKDELVEFLSSLPPVRIGDSYTEEDRARDFIAVFNGASDAVQGARVLSQIAAICDPPIATRDLSDHGVLAGKSGMRRVFQEIQRCFVVKAPVPVQREPFEPIPLSGGED